MNKLATLGPIAHDGPEGSPIARQVKEWDRVDIAAGLILDDGKLDAYPSILNRDYFTLSAGSTGLTLQAGGFIGVIPLNERLTIEVTPRVPVNNLSRILRIAEHVPVALEDTSRLYTLEPEVYPSLIDLYAQTLIKHVEEIALRGVLREYARRQEATSFPRGRILMTETLKSLAPRGIQHKVVATWFQRSIDNPANRCIKYAAWFLSRFRSEAGRPRLAGSRKITQGLGRAFRVFDGVELDLRRSFLFDPVVVGNAPLPPHRAHYRPVLDLCRVIIKQQAVRLDQPGGVVGLPSLVLNMSTAFESYLRQVLVAWAEQHGGLRVLNGNHAPPDGGQKPLFDSGAATKASPDIVLVPKGSAEPRLVLEVKYKPSERAVAREDVNQAIAYGASYRCARVLLVQPRGPRDAEPQGIRELGTINNMRVDRYVYDLGVDELQTSEAELCEDLAAILASP